MPTTDWKTPYEAALRMQDPAQLHEACKRARAAIHQRAAELEHNPTDSLAELQELEAALSRIWVHESASRSG